jgi:hypothetical protein
MNVMRKHGVIGKTVARLREAPAGTQVDGSQKAGRFKGPLIVGLAAGLIAAVAFVPGSAAAGSQNQFTLYSYVEDGINAGASADFFTSPPTGGATYYQASRVFPAPVTETQAKDPAYVAANSVGKMYTQCAAFANLQDPPGTAVDSFKDGECVTTLVFNNTADSLEIVGYFQELNQVPPNCPDSFNILAVSGGTGKYIGALGEVAVTHRALNPDVNQDCAHTKHGFTLKFTLVSSQQ